MISNERKAARIDDAYLSSSSSFSSVLRVNYDFVPVHRQRVRIIMVIVNDDEGKTPEISILLLLLLHLVSIRIDDTYGGDLPQLAWE